MKNNEIIEVLTELLNSIPTKILKATITFSLKNMEGEYSAEVKADNLNKLLIELGNIRNQNTGSWNTGTPETATPKISISRIGISAASIRKPIPYTFLINLRM